MSLAGLAFFTQKPEGTAAAHNTSGSYSVKEAAQARARSISYAVSVLSDKHIDEFIAIYEREFGETITREEARAMADRLVNLYRVLLQEEEKAARKKRDASL